jgi:hypothetical protein
VTAPVTRRRFIAGTVTAAAASSLPAVARRPRLFFDTDWSAVAPPTKEELADGHRS